MLRHSELLKDRNPWAIENFARRFSVFWPWKMKEIEKRRKRGSWQEEHQWVERRIKGSTSSVSSAGPGGYQEQDGHLPGRRLPVLPLSSYYQQNEGMADLQHMLALVIFLQYETPRGCLYPYLKSMPYRQNPSLELECRSQWVSCCSSLEKLVRKQDWTCDSQESGIGHKEFGVAYSGSQLIETQINQISSANPYALLRLSISGWNLEI